MRTILKIFSLCLLMVSCAKPILNVNFVAKNTIEGYDHLNRIVVYCDGKEVARSAEQIQSKPNSVKNVAIPKGKHTIKCVMEAFDKETKKWEARTIENNYSVDCQYEEQVSLSSAQTWSFVLDIDKSEFSVDKK